MANTRLTRNVPNWMTLLWICGPGVLGTTVYLFSLGSGSEHFVSLYTLPYYSIGISIIHAAFSRCRPTLQQLLCPGNWALFVFMIHLVAAPCSVAISGATLSVYPDLPSDASINLSMLLNLLAYAAYSFVYDRSMKGHTAPVEHLVMPHKTASTWKMLLVAAFVAIGILGFVLSFEGFDELVTYYLRPSLRPHLQAPGSATLQMAIAQMSRPFLTFGVILFWCLLMERKTVARSPLARGSVTAAIVFAVLLASGGGVVNRGTMVVPVVAMAGSYSLMVRRLRGWVLILSVAAGFLALLALGAYRNGTAAATDLTDNDLARQELVRRVDATATLQLQFQAPQFSAFLFDRTEWGKHLYFGKTLLASLVYPVPVFGRPFREYSGVSLLNQMIYNAPFPTDQIISFAGELFLNFHLFGVIIGFGLLARVLFQLNRAFLETQDMFSAFALLYVAIWTIVLINTSIEVLSQSLIYLCGPLGVYSAHQLLRKGRTRRRRIAPFIGTSGRLQRVFE